MREIGSEFWDVPFKDSDNGFFPDTTQWFLSGRSALSSIIDQLEFCHTVELPSWCCDSMISPFINAGVEVHFYPVLWDGGLFQKPCFDCDAILLIDYFGYSSAQVIPNDYNGTVIRDVSHSLFSKTYEDADYYFGSLRKWCGFWTGGFAWTNEGELSTIKDDLSDEYCGIRKKAMLLKETYMSNDFKNQQDKSEYLRFFNDAEIILDRNGPFSADIRDVECAHRLDISFIKQKRRANAKLLMDEFKDWLIFPNLNEVDCPLFVPVLVPANKRNELRQYLIDNEIYCPVHWPVSKYHVLDNKELFLYENELSLICDQRYDEVDMHRMIDTINDWKGVN